MFEFLTTSIFGASSAPPAANHLPQGGLPGTGPTPEGGGGLAPEALPASTPPPAAPPPPVPAASTQPADTAAPVDPAALDKQLELQKQITSVTHADGAWLWGADTGKLMKLVESSPDTLEAMRTQSPEMYRMMRAGVLAKLDDDERKKALELMPEASLQDINRERHERGELTPELNEEVKKITPDRKKELEEAVAEIKASQGLLSNDLGKVRASLAGKSPAEVEAMRRLWLDKFPGSVLNMDQFLKANYDDGDDAAEVAGLLSGDKVKATAGTVMNALYGMNDSKAAFDALEKVKEPEVRAKVAEEFKARWLERLKADGETADLAALENDPALADPLKFMEKVTSEQTDGVIFHDADSDLAKHLVNGEYGKAAAVKLEQANGVFNDDEDAGYAALDGLEDPKLRAEFDAELKQRGTSLDEQLAHLDGAEVDVAMAKLEGDKKREQAARMRVAAEGLGTDKAALYKALEGKSKKERDAIVAEYDKRYGKESGRGDALDFNEMLVDELDEQDAGRIIFLDDEGKLDPEFALKYAREGGGTDEKMGEDALKRMPADKRKQLLADPEFMADTFNLSKEEFEQVQKDPSSLPMLLMKNRNALDLLDVQEVSGKDGFAWAQALLGNDYNQDGKVDETDTILKAKDSYEFARGEGAGVLAKMADSAHVSDMEVNLDLQHERILAMQSKLVSGEMTDADRERLKVLARYQDQDMKTVLEQRDEVAQAAAGAAAATAGLIVTVATAGGGGAAAMAAWKIAMASAVASGTAGLGVKMAIQGDHMTNEAFATDLAMMVAQAASGGVLASDKAGAIFKAMGAGMGKLASSPAGQKALSMLVQEAAKGGAQALGPAMVSALTNEEMWKGDGDPAKMFATMMLTQIASGAASNVTAAGLKGAIDSKQLANFLGGAGSATVSELINNNEAIAQAVREGRVTTEALQSIISIAQSGADNMAEDAVGGGHQKAGGADVDAAPATLKSPQHGGADATPHVPVIDAPAANSEAPTRRAPQSASPETSGPDTLRSPGVKESDRTPAPVFPETQRTPGVQAPPANDDARYHYGPTADDQFAEGWLAADVEAEAYAYGDKARKEAGLPEFVPLELTPEARPAHAPEVEAGPRPFEDMFQERLEGEGDYSDDPDPHGYLTPGGPDTMRYTPADQLATVKPPGYDGPVDAQAHTIAMPAVGPDTMRYTPADELATVKPPGYDGPVDAQAQTIAMPAVGPDTMRYTPADQLATVKPPGYDAPVHAGADTVRVPEMADQPGTMRSPQMTVTPDGRVVPVTVVDAGPVDLDAPTVRRPAAAEDVEAHGPNTRRSEGVTEGDRLPAPEFPATKRSDELAAPAPAVDPLDMAPDPEKLASYRLQLSPEAMAVVLEGAPGMDRVRSVSPDGGGDGAITPGEAMYRIGLVEEMAKSPIGRRMLDVIGARNLPITLESGAGHEYANGRINLDPSMARTPHAASGLGVHEAYHAATFDQQVNVNAQTREQFLHAMLGNEGQAQAMLFEHYKQAGGDGSEHFGHNLYAGAYEAAKAHAMANGASEAEAHAAAVSFGMDQLKYAFAAQVPGAYAEQGPDGRYRPRPGGPQNYAEAYGQYWDQQHPRQLGPAPEIAPPAMVTRPPMLGDDVAPPAMVGKPPTLDTDAPAAKAPVARGEFDAAARALGVDPGEPIADAEQRMAAHLRGDDAVFGSQRATREVINRAGSASETLSPEEYAALRMYTMAHYGAINAAMRDAANGGDGQAMARLKPIVDAASAGLAKLPDFEGTAYRGAALPPEVMAKYKAALDSGELYSDGAFTSASTDAALASTFLARELHKNGGAASDKVPVMFEIKSKTGKQVDFLSRTPIEGEVMFDGNTGFKVVAIEEVTDAFGNKSQKIVLEEASAQAQAQVAARAEDQGGGPATKPSSTAVAADIPPPAFVNGPPVVDAPAGEIAPPAMVTRPPVYGDVPPPAMVTRPYLDDLDVGG